MTTKWTIVQHSGWGYRHKPEFEHGVEPRAAATIVLQRKVTKAGGVLFDDYNEAEEFTDQANHPEGHESMHPRASGTFSTVQVDGLAVYLPSTPPVR